MKEYIKILEGHKKAVNKIIFSADGNRIISCGKEASIRIWDIFSGECLAVLEGHESEILNIAFHPDGKRLISYSNDKTFRIWDIDKGISLATKKFIADRPDDYIIHAKGDQIVFWNNKSSVIQLWDCVKYEDIWLFEGHTEEVNQIIIHPDNKRIISWVLFGKKESFKIWDLESGVCNRQLDDFHTEGLELFPDGRRLAVWDRDFYYDGYNRGNKNRNPEILIYDINKGEITVKVDAHKNTIDRIIPFENGDKFISYGDDEFLKIWDSNSGECLKDLNLRKSIRYAEFHPDKKRIILNLYKELQIRYINDFDDKQILIHENEIRGYYFVPHSDENILVVLTDKIVCVWDIDEGRCLNKFEDESFIGTIFLHPDGKHIISCGKSINLIDIENGKAVDVTNKKHNNGLKIHKNNSIGHLLSPNGKKLISWREDGDIVIWKIDQ